MLASVPTSPRTAPTVEAAARIRDDLSTLEASLDQAIAAAAALTRSMIEARRVSGVPVHTGQTALIRLQRAQAELVAASSNIFRVHDELATLAKTLMITDDPTPISGLLADDEPLRAVA